jgi:PHD/YefM family antitoxin component YafN of YafNO toxin-antitoxin module
MPVIKASEFHKRVRKFRDLARREPVTVTWHGRAYVVLLAAEVYQRLRQIEQRATRAMAVADLPPETAEAIRSADLSHLPAD